MRPARRDDVGKIMPVLDEARAYQKRSGHPQWEAGYPSVEDIERDLERNRPMVLTLDGTQVVGYAALVADDEGYKGISLWDSGRAYLAIHRLALSDTCRGKGLGVLFFNLIREYAIGLGIEELRFDTGLQNLPMQHIADRLGYECLGKADFSWGPRLAYRLKLE